MSEFVMPVNHNNEHEGGKEISLTRYDEIEKEAKKAIEDKEIDRLLLLNELTLARNHFQKNVSKKEFAVCYVAFVNDGEVIKRAGIYATEGRYAISQEEAEDILLAQDFHNKKVLAIPRYSMYTSLF